MLLSDHNRVYVHWEWNEFIPISASSSPSQLRGSDILHSTKDPHIEVLESWENMGIKAEGDLGSSPSFATY